MQQFVYEQGMKPTYKDAIGRNVCMEINFKQDDHVLLRAAGGMTLPNCMEVENLCKKFQSVLLIGRVTRYGRNIEKYVFSHFRSEKKAYL